MTAYIIRRVLYAIPTLIGVNVLIFALFFVVNSPDDMARTILGDKNVSRAAIENWKQENGYHLPLFWNAEAAGVAQLTDTIFFTKAVRLFIFDFGNADRSGTSIGAQIRLRMGPSLAIAVPAFLLGLLVNITCALIVAFYRATYLDYWALILCVITMSISALFYIIGGQYVFAICLRLVPISGYEARNVHAQIYCASGCHRRCVRHRCGGSFLPYHFSGSDRQRLYSHGPCKGTLRDAGAVQARA